jgi:DNA-binding XRE family transcriptional regulator
MTMHSNKRKRLEAKGWKIGSVKEFLGLSAEEEAYVEIKLRLSESFREYRLRQKMTQSDVAKIIGSSQSRVAKMECGDSSVSLDLLVRSLLALGASPKGLVQFLSPRKSSRAA